MTKDTNTATNSETREHEAYKVTNKGRDSTQKNADALYESNNEEEESKDVVVISEPMTDLVNEAKELKLTENQQIFSLNAS